MKWAVSYFFIFRFSSFNYFLVWSSFINSKIILPKWFIPRFNVILTLFFGFSKVFCHGHNSSKNTWCGSCIEVEAYSVTFFEDLLIVVSSAIGDSESFGILVKRETDDSSWEYLEKLIYMICESKCMMMYRTIGDSKTRVISILSSLRYFRKESLSRLSWPSTSNKGFGLHLELSYNESDVLRT